MTPRPTPDQVPAQGVTPDHETAQGATPEHVAAPGATPEHETAPGATPEHETTVPGETIHQVPALRATPEHGNGLGLTPEQVPAPGATPEPETAPGSSPEQVPAPGATPQHKPTRQTVRNILNFVHYGIGFGEYFGAPFSFFSFFGCLRFKVSFMGQKYGIVINLIFYTISGGLNHLFRRINFSIRTWYVISENLYFSFIT